MSRCKILCTVWKVETQNIYKFCFDVSAQDHILCQTDDKHNNIYFSISQMRNNFIQISEKMYDYIGFGHFENF